MCAGKGDALCSAFAIVPPEPHVGPSHEATSASADYRRPRATDRERSETMSGFPTATLVVTVFGPVQHVSTDSWDCCPHPRPPEAILVSTMSHLFSRRWFAEAASARQDLVIAELGHPGEKRAPSPCVRTGAAGHAHEFVRAVEGAFS
jgi:hypothetical protein